MKTLANAADLIGLKHGSRSGRLIGTRLCPVSFSSVEDLGERLGVDAFAVLDLMGIPQRTRARRRQDGLLKADEADRLLRIARVFGEAVRVFGSEEKARLWLKTPSPLFEDSAPLTWVGSDGGAHAVSEELVRIDFGDFA